MKIIHKILLVTFSIIVFLLLVMSVNLRFQILSLRFWIDNFSRNNTYILLSDSIKKNSVTQASAKGVKTGDVGILDELISPKNVEDLINNNFTNLFEYTNGISNELIVYVPIDKIPKSMISKELSNISSEMKFEDMINQLNIKGISPSFIKQLGHIGLWSWAFFYLFTVLYVLLLFFLYRSIDYGKRFTALALSLTISGFLVLIVGLLGRLMAVILSSAYTTASNIESSFVTIIFPPIISGIFTVWLWFGATIGIIGLVLFFIRKGQYNRAK